MNMTMSRSMTDVLNKQVANCSVLYMKLHHYHWFVKGREFFTLHSKFEELYNEAAANMDELAERLLAIGGTPVSTLKACLAESSIQEAGGRESVDQMVQAVLQDLNTMIKEMNEGIKAAETAGDAVTGDIFTGMCKSLEKHAWMLRTYMQQG